MNTLAVIAELNELHLHGVFFMIGGKIAAHLPAVSAEIANGEVIGNHTWDHRSFTGKGAGTKPLTQAQVRAELAQTSAAIVAAGRPAAGTVAAALRRGGRQRRRDGQDPRAAHRAGQRDQHHRQQRLGRPKPAQIAARVDPVLRDGTIIAFHDGLSTATEHHRGAAAHRRVHERAPPRRDHDRAPGRDRRLLHRRPGQSAPGDRDDGIGGRDVRTFTRRSSSSRRGWPR